MSLKNTVNLLMVLILGLTACSQSVLNTATSNGPGPVTWIVSQKQQAKAGLGKGTARSPFKTISEAAAIAKPGDTVLVLGGIYRERVSPGRSGEPGKPIVYKASPNEEVIIRGSERWTPNWQPVQQQADVFTGQLDAGLFGKFNPYQTTAKRLFGKKSLGQVFVDGQPFAEVDKEADLYNSPGTWMVMNNGSALQIHFTPSDKKLQDRVVEITVRDRIFAPHTRGLGYITVQGFIMEHCANQFPSGFYQKPGGNGAPQAGALGTRSGNHWVIEHNTIRFAKGLGLDCGSEGGYDLEGDQPMPEDAGYHLIANNIISDNGAGGIAGWKHTGTKIIGNVIERNNLLGWTAPETGGIKVHSFIDGLIEGNIIRDNDCSGIWLDNVWYNSRVTRNVVINSTGHGIFVEMGEGSCLVDNNVVAFTKSGDGIYTHDASGATFAHNLLYGNAHFGMYMRIVTDRMAGNEKGVRTLVATRDQKILNNVFVDNYRGAISLPLPAERVSNNVSDYNLFIGGTQWQWEGLRFNSFSVNTSNGEKDKDAQKKLLLKAFTDALDKSNVPQSQRPNLVLWQQQPLLTFDWWKALTGNDLHSFAPVVGQGKVENGAIAKGSMSFSPGEMYVQFQTDKPFRQLNCLPVAGVDKDFYGNKMDSSQLLPGPFQKFNEGYTRMVLYPDTKQK